MNIRNWQYLDSDKNAPESSAGKMGLTRIRENDMQISRFFVNGDIKGAIDYMRDHEEFKDILPAYVAIFEDQKYRTYEILDDLNNILRLYHIYFRDTFYCGSPEAEAADKLRTVPCFVPEA